MISWPITIVNLGAIRLMYFQDLDVSTLLLATRSTARERLLVWAVSVALLVSLLMAYWYAPVIPDQEMAKTAETFGSFVIDAFGAAAIITIVQRLLFPMKHTLMDRLRRFTPIGVVEERDRAALDDAYLQVMESASKIDLRKALELAKYDAEILAFGNLRVIAHQRRGTLSQWMNTEARIRQACYLLYLCHRAEQKQQQVTETGRTDIF